MTETEERELRLKIVQEIGKIIVYAGVRADGNVNGLDLLDAIKVRTEEIQQGNI